MAAPTAAAAAAGGLSPCASFVEESLILPGRNPGLFLRLVALLFAHTFVFLSLAVRSAHPAATALLSLLHDDAPPPRTTRFNGFGAHRSSWSHADYYYPSSTGGGEALEHGKTLLLVYLAYLASKLAAQVAVSLAASAAARGGRPLAAALRGGRSRALAAAAAFLAALELASTALLAACLASWWTYFYSTATAMASFFSGALLFLLLVVAVPARLCLAAAVPVAIAALTSPSAPEVNGGPSALRRAWRLMAARERRKEAAVLVAAAGLLPVVASPVYAFALACGPGPRDGGVFALLAMLPGYLFPSVAVQLFSTVAAAVFCHRFGGHHEPAAIPLTAAKAVA